MQTIEELLVSINIDLRNGKATQLTLAEVEKKFFGVASAAEKADKHITTIGANTGLKNQVAHTTQFLAQITHTNSALHAMHLMLTKLGGLGTLGSIVGVGLAGIGAYKLSEKVGEYEQAQRLTDFTFGEKSDQVRREATDTAREFGTNEIDLLEGYRQMTKKGVGGSMKDVLVLQEAAKLEKRTLASAVEAIADAQVGEFKRLKEYGIKGSSPRGGKDYRLLNAATGDVQTVAKDDPQAVREVVMAMITEKYGGALEATKETIPAKMQNVKGALWQGNESVWSNFAKGAVDPIYEAWKDMSEDLIAWIKQPEVQQAIQNIGRAVGEVVLLIARIVQFVSTFVASMMPFFDFAATTLGIIFDIFETGLNTLNVAMTGSFQETVNAWNEWGEVIWLGLELILLSFTNAVLDVLGQLIPGFDGIMLHVADFFESMGGYWETAKDWVSSFIDFIIASFNDVASTVLDGFINSLTGMANVLRNLVGLGDMNSAQSPMAQAPNQTTSVNATYNIQSSTVSDGLAASRLNTNYLYR